ncbi:MAG: glycoside hydrolase family 2 protein, partial [Clostridia bacterium]|nr:glycoside hydrolase family 2 protein [Clostridia bacterium]
MKRILLNGTWKLSGNGYECTGTVPGSVYSILLENKLMDDPYYRENESKALEIAEHDYAFTRSFFCDNTYETALLFCDGLDTLCDI